MFSHLVCHQSGHGPANLMVLRPLAMRTQKQEKKPLDDKYKNKP